MRFSNLVISLAFNKYDVCQVCLQPADTRSHVDAGRHKRAGERKKDILLEPIKWLKFLLGAMPPFVQKYFNRG